MAKQGDYVRFLNSVGGGRVLRQEGSTVIVEDADGFEVPVPARECVVVAEAGSDRARKMQAQEEANARASEQAKNVKKSKPTLQPSTADFLPPQPAPQQPQSKYVETDPDMEIIETDRGDTMNVMLAFEPSNIKELSKSTFDCVLVNDSNYYLNFIFATRPEDTQEWTVKKIGTVEPNIVLSLYEFAGSDFADFSRVNIQFVAYKLDKAFQLKRPVSVIQKLDMTSFFKVNCYAKNVYFDQPVIALEIVRDNEPYRLNKPDARALEAAMRQKRNIDRQPQRPVVKRAEQRRQGEAIVVDLHINELVDTTRGLSAADMLNLQVDEFRRVMDANLKNKGQKIIFIHGKGEGVLRNALTKELNYRYKTHQVEDAPYQQFGSGATMVIIR